MKRQAFALVMAAAALAPAQACAGWNTTNYTSTFEVVRDIRNTLTRWCSVNAAAQLHPQTADLADACGQALSGQTVQGVPFGFEKTYNEVELVTASKWTFALVYPSRLYLFSVVDETRHQSNVRDRATDVRSSRMEVEALDLGAITPNAYRLTHGTAWRGTKTGNRPKDERDPPKVSDFEDGLGRALRDLRQLRFAVREAYRIN